MSKILYNLQYFGVARWYPSLEVICSYAPASNVKNDLREVINEEKIIIQTNRNYRITSTTGEWYLIVDDTGLLYFMLCKEDYPYRLRYKCLEQLQNDFLFNHADRAMTAKSNQIKDEKLFTLFLKFEQGGKLDKLAALRRRESRKMTRTPDNPTTDEITDDATIIDQNQPILFALLEPVSFDQSRQEERNHVSRRLSSEKILPPQFQSGISTTIEKPYGNRPWRLLFVPCCTY